VGIAQTDPNTGEYEIRLPGGQLYGVHAEANDKISESQNLDLRNYTQDAVIDHKDFSLETIKVSPIEEKVTIVLNNVFFDFDKSILKAESFPELNRLVDLMKERPQMQVEIAGHADATGPEQYNLGLSERRANAVAKYIVEKGIEMNRITAVFFGESQPAETNETKDGRKKNRRVEFKILKL
jgi:outer membrane protein OmpA-like peptidoglycan-associated protein